MQQRRHVFICLIFVVFGLCLAAVAIDGVSSPTTSHAGLASGVTCGVNCVYAASLFTEKHVDFQMLLQRKYIGSPKGSTLEELAAAAQDNGLYIQELKNLTMTSLRDSPYPVILHVRRTVLSKNMITGCSMLG